MEISNSGQKEQGHSLKRILYAEVVGISSSISAEPCCVADAAVVRTIKLF